MFDDDEAPDLLKGLSEDQLVARVQGLAARRAHMDHEEAQVLAEVERRRYESPSVFRDTASWLVDATGVSRWTARVRTEVARQLVHLPCTEADLGLERITWDHVRVIADRANSPLRDQVLDDQQHLSRLAHGVGAEEYRRRVDDWAADLEAQRDAQESDHERKVRRRSLRRWRRREDGMNMRLLALDDESANSFDRAVNDLVRDRVHAERHIGGPDEQISIERRRAEAVIELVDRSRAADQITRHRARPTILALCDADLLWDQLKVRGYAELSDGTRITPQQLRRLACEADIVPIIRDEYGVPLDMGRTVRLATEPQRLALRTTHSTCAMAGCDVPFDWCEIHHLFWWEHGGRTDLVNLVPLCGYHHHLVHDMSATVSVSRDRVVTVTGVCAYRIPPRRRVKWLETPHRPPDRVPART